MVKERKYKNNKKSIIGFILTSLAVLSLEWQAFEFLALIGLIICIVGLIETLKNNEKLFYSIAGIILGIIFSLRLIFSTFIYLSSLYNIFIAILCFIMIILAIIFIILGINNIKDKENKKTKYFIIIGLILIIIFVVLFVNPSNTQDRLEYKLKEYGKKYFENDTWLNGGIAQGVYSVSLQDLEEKLKEDISVFNKYNCDVENTRVEFVVGKEIEKGKTNFSYNIILDCDI